MKLKEILEKFSNDTQGYEYNSMKQGLVNLENDLEKLIEQVALQSFHDGTLDGVGAIFGSKKSRFSKEYWQENKSRFLGE